MGLQCIPLSSGYVCTCTCTSLCAHKYSFPRLSRCVSPSCTYPFCAFYLALGLQGFKGEKGLEGPPGADGRKGAIGTPGLDGQQGEKGFKGEPGM